MRVVIGLVCSKGVQSMWDANSGECNFSIDVLC
jgi:hypothetical protein